MGDIGRALLAFIIEANFGQEHIGGDTGGGDEPKFIMDPLLNLSDELLGGGMG